MRKEHAQNIHVSCNQSISNERKLKWRTGSKDSGFQVMAPRARSMRRISTWPAINQFKERNCDGGQEDELLVNYYR
jgi:hypothetical protein